MHKNGYDFSRFVLPLKFIEKNHNHEITLDEAIEDQIKLEILISKQLQSKESKKIQGKNKGLQSSKELFDAREDITGLFKRGTFPYKGDVFKIK